MTRIRKRGKTRSKGTPRREEVSNDSSLIYGIMPVLEKLRGSSPRIRKIILAVGREDTRTKEILDLARENGVPVVRKERRELSSFFDREVNHQGVAAVVKNAELIGVQELIERADEGEGIPLIVVLDGIQDPGNMGAIIRSAECAGVGGLIFSMRDSVGITETVVKASAGATENVDLAQAKNLGNAIEALKSAGFWVIGADGKGETRYHDWDFKQKTAIVLGSEGKGMRRLTAEKCDALVNIPLKGTVESLNVSVAAGVLLFEANRQRSTGN